VVDHIIDHTRTTHIHILSLHDALPIFRKCAPERRRGCLTRHLPPQFALGSMNSRREQPQYRCLRSRPARSPPGSSTVDRTELDRSEEHTSELQSRENLVCRLLLETKKY